MDRRAGKAFRIKRRRDISRLFDRGRRVSDDLVTLLVLPNELGCARTGVVVGARHGNAVRRNRIKRLCREAFRPIRRELPAGRDYLILPRTGRDFSVRELQASIRALAGRLADRQTVQGERP